MQEVRREINYTRAGLLFSALGSAIILFTLTAVWLCPDANGAFDLLMEAFIGALVLVFAAGMIIAVVIGLLDYLFPKVIKTP